MAAPPPPTVVDRLVSMSSLVAFSSGIFGGFRWAKHALPQQGTQGSLWDIVNPFRSAAAVSASEWHSWTTVAMTVCVCAVPMLACALVPFRIGDRKQHAWRYSALHSTLSTIVISAALGVIFGTGLITASSLPFAGIGLYMSVLSFFHWSEFLVTSLFNYNSLTFDSFLLNHSPSYGLALVASLIELVTETAFLTQIKSNRVAAFGLVCCVLGELIRKLAMTTARHNFTHLIAYEKRPEHALVTSGVFGLCRHPSYVGWFWWSVSSQVVLCNPLCTVAYALAAYTFFNERIEEEERLLINFFGHKYIKYQEKVPVGIPFIRGYQLSESQRDLLTSMGDR